MKTTYSQQMLAAATMMAGIGQPESLERMVEKSIFGGSGDEVKKYLVKNKKTVEQEYQLIQEKKSSLSKRQRDYVKYLHNRMQKTQEEGDSE